MIARTVYNNNHSEFAFAGKLSVESEAAKWFVMRAYKREREAEEKLAEMGMEFFIPKCFAIRIYHGVKHRKLVPAIPGLIFVRASRTDITEFKKSYNLLQFVVWRKSSGPEYLVVDDRQMANFMKAASHPEQDITYFLPEEIDLRCGTQVRILGGVFDGVEGVFVRVAGRGRKRKVVVKLDGLLAVTIEAAPDLVEVVK